MQGAIIAYKMGRYPYQTGQGHILGSLAWASVGWDAGGTGVIVPPAEHSYPIARPNPRVYPDKLQYHVGDPANPNTGPGSIWGIP